VVRFKDDVPLEQVATYLEAAGAQPRRGSAQAPGAALIESTEESYDAHLATMARWMAADPRDYAAADLMTEDESAAFPDDPPSDKRYGTQANLDLQGVPAASYRSKNRPPLRLRLAPVT